MTKRLGMFLGLGFFGVVLLLTGLSWDAVVHANDPTLAGREGIFTLRNPGHVFLGVGIGLVLVSLIGGCDTLLAASRNGRWSGPRVRQAFLTVSAAVVVTAAAVTSWAATTGHEHMAGGGHGHDAQGQLAAAVDGHHSHPAAVGAPGGEVAGHDHATGAVPGAEAPAESAAHDHDAAGGGDEATGASGPAAHAHAAAGTRATSAPAPHDHHPTTSSGPAAAPATGGHDHPGPAADGGTAAGGGPAAGGDHPHDPAAPQSPVSNAPQGTWGQIRVGPFVIPPEGAGGGADHANIAVPSIAKPCTNCFLQQFEPDLVYADGTSANLDTGMMLHHAVLFAAGRQDATCGPEQPFPGKLGERFFASGNERTSGAFPAGFGYYVDPGNWSGIFHIMNHAAETKTVFFQVKVRWSPAAAGGILPLRPIWLDMNNCRTSEYAVPAGPSSSHWSWTSNLTGRVVATAGHVHDGGLRTTLTNQTTGEHLCTSWAGWGRKAAYQGTIESMSACTWDRVGTVQKGEVLNLETAYNSQSAVPDAMGIMMAFVYETTDLAAGTPAPPAVRGQNPPPVESTPPPSGHEH
jgi:hypothetical protein